MMKSKISILILLVIGIISFAEFSDYLEFSPKNYEVIERTSTLGGTITNVKVDEDVSHININLDKNGYKYYIHMLNFDSIVSLQDFWYTFVSENSDKLNSAFSSIPLLYGEFNDMYGDYILKAWFSGLKKEVYIIIGDQKSDVDDLKFRIKKFR